MSVAVVSNLIWDNIFKRLNKSWGSLFRILNIYYFAFYVDLSSCFFRP